MTVAEFIMIMENDLNLPLNHHLVAVFASDAEETIIGVMCVENGVPGEYPVLTIPELYEKYGD